jgi:hypothetical protein
MPFKERIRADAFGRRNLSNRRQARTRDGKGRLWLGGRCGRLRYGGFTGSRFVARLSFPGKIGRGSARAAGGYDPCQYKGCPYGDMAEIHVSFLHKLP